jgi:hypothetical protein
MLKKTVLVVLVFISTTVFANETFTQSIKLDKHYKVENTFSGDLFENTSFHFIFTKNKKTKKKEILGYLYNGNSVEKLESFSNFSYLKITSFHNTKSHLIVLFSYEEDNSRYLKKVVYDLNTKKISENITLTNERFEASFRTKDRSVLIYKIKDTLKTRSFNGINKVELSKYIFSDKKDPVKKYFKGSIINTIKTDEFVANGSTSELKAYLDKNKIIFTKDDSSKNQCSVLTISLDKDKIIPSKILKFENKNGDKTYKKSISYYNNDHLYFLSLGKKSGAIKVFNISKNKEINNISLNADLHSQILKNKDFKGIEDFLKNAGKNKFKPTITVNKTNSDKLRVRVDYVDVNYGYYNDWWWHHQQFMRWQNQFHMQQMRVNLPSGFGPNPPEYVDTSFLNTQKRYFELTIDSNGNINQEDSSETIYKEIDKKQYIKTLEEIKNIKHESSCFLKNSFRYIGYSKKRKEFIFQTNKIK